VSHRSCHKGTTAHLRAGGECLHQQLAIASQAMRIMLTPRTARTSDCRAAFHSAVGLTRARPLLQRQPKPTRSACAITACHAAPAQPCPPPCLLGYVVGSPLCAKPCVQPPMKRHAMRQPHLHTNDKTHTLATCTRTTQHQEASCVWWARRSVLCHACQAQSKWSSQDQLPMKRHAMRQPLVHTSDTAASWQVAH
jgi:hypothetical protein